MRHMVIPEWVHRDLDSELMLLHSTGLAVKSASCLVNWWRQCSG